MANDFVQYILNSVSLPTQNGNLRPSDIPPYVAQNNARFADFDHDAFASNNVGYKAFILQYASPGTGENDSSRGQATLDNPSHWLTVTNQYSDLKEGIDATAEEGQSTANQAVAQMLNINSPQMRVWIPSLDIDLEVPNIQPSPNIRLWEKANSRLHSGYTVVNINLFRMCTIDREEYKTSPPPVGSLILVDFEDRAGQGGLAMTGLITQDRQFCRAVLKTLSTDNPTGSPRSLHYVARRAQTAELANNGINVPTGDQIGTLEVPDPIAVSAEIAQLAANYDNDVPDRVPLKEGASAGKHRELFERAHPDFVPYMKAFARKAWDNRKATIHFTSSYRSHSEQLYLHRNWMIWRAFQALPASQRATMASSGYYHFEWGIGYGGVKRKDTQAKWTTASPYNSTSPPTEQQYIATDPDKTSYHSLGLAFDFSPTWGDVNPGGVVPSTPVKGLHMLAGQDGPGNSYTAPASEWKATGIVEDGTTLGLQWGGDWTGKHLDPIHFDFGFILYSYQKQAVLDAAKQQGVEPNRVDLSAFV
jgi:hypothetical protein